MSTKTLSICLSSAAIAALLSLAVGQGSTLAQAGPDAPIVSASDVLVLGDSLAVGTMPYLDSMLPADVNLTWDAVDGRTTPQGIDALRQDLREVEPKLVVVSLGSNDGPDPKRFTSRIQQVLADLSPNTCVAWFSIVRPARKGRYLALNGALRAQARRDHRLIVINWDNAVRRGTVFLPDGLHADAAGYRYRSSKVVQAVHAGCRAE
jgi:lysophospholipase L1-like esterase